MVIRQHSMGNHMLTMSLPVPNELPVSLKGFLNHLVGGELHKRFPLKSPFAIGDKGNSIFDDIQT